MFTPQEVQEKTFVKAVFGGYDMQTVDEFLEPLIEDYITLYKENAVLKSKMKVLVEKLEEYRNQEASMRSTMISAQRAADNMMAEAEKKVARMMAEAQANAQPAAGSADADLVVKAEEARVNSAKQTAQSFIENIEKEIRSHLDLLENLKKQDLTPTPVEAPAPRKVFDFDQAEAVPVPVKTESTEAIASEIEQNISRLMDLEEPAPQPAPRPAHADSATIKFTNLQFGPGYDPTGK